MAKSTGAIHLKLDDIIGAYADRACADYKERDSVALDKIKKTIMIEGKALEDDQLIKLIIKRLQQKDVLEKGWIFEDFPKTKAQAIKLARFGV
jgi:adenylate kinase family enzyme